MMVVNILINISYLPFWQAVCLEPLLNLLPKGDKCPLELPPDSLGNTAAHESASKGHLRCFKVNLLSKKKTC